MLVPYLLHKKKTGTQPPIVIPSQTASYGGATIIDGEKHMRAITTVFLGAFLTVTSVAIAADAGPDPVVGTWTLNVAKSQFNQGPALKSDTRTYEESADGMMTVTLKSVSADGTEITLTRTFKEDGKDYPVHDSSGVDSITETRVNARTAKYTEKKAGKAMLRGRRVLSKDGKTLKVTEIGTEAGAKIKHTLVYDKQ